MSIDTVHLRLIPYAPGHLLALIESVPQFEKQFGLRAAEALREFIVSDDVSPAFLASLHGATAADPWVHGPGVLTRRTTACHGQ